MILAIAACRAPGGLDLLRGIDPAALEPMTRVALGEALVRLEQTGPEDAAPLVRALAHLDAHMRKGAVRTVLSLRMRLDPAASEVMAAHAGTAACAEYRTEILLGAPGWTGERARGWLEREAGSGDPLARSALTGKWQKWNPL